MYDFSTDKTTICDVDFFKKAPVINDKGVEWFGTKRFKAPEEYIKAINLFHVLVLIGS